MFDITTGAEKGTEADPPRSELYTTIEIDQQVNVINTALQEAFQEACSIISSADCYHPGYLVKSRKLRRV